jgi:phosphoribosylformylglycinamidine synthase II
MNITVNVQLAREMGMKPDEYDRLVGALQRTPTLCELGVVSAMWSEHCSYKSSKVHLRRLPTTGPRVVQGPGENAGAVDIGGGYCIVFKMESHNHPSYIEPFQGAATGVGGILRDVFTMGARPIALLDSLRFGDPKLPKTKSLVEGVVSGISHYGNCMGVPVVGGETTFDSAYDGNCLVNVCAVGVAQSDKLFRGYASGVGNPVFYLGAKTGRDGIHGATMASDEFNASNEKRRPTVQIGDPFREKILLECCLELMHKDLLLGIQDMGAAGLTSSSAEMAARAENGIELELSRVPTREPGMSAYEIMLSESQERMLFVAKPGKEEEVLQIAAKWDLDAVAIGVVTDTKRLIVKMNGQVEAELPISLLADDAPRYDRAKQPPSDLEARHNAPRPEAPRDLGVTLFELLSHPDIASKRWIYEQYDHQVRNATLVGPGSADAAVLRVLDPQDSSKDTGAVIALTVDCPVRFCALDPRRGAQLTIYEGARNLACVGARAIGATDCLNLGNPEKPEVTWQLSEVIDGMADACRALEVPIVSGNVSLYNENRGKAVHPTPSVAMVGLVCEVGSAKAPATPGVLFRRAGECIAIIGEPARSSLGGSLYAFAIHGQITGRPVLAQPELEKKTNEAIIEMVHAELLSSAHDVSGGGLAVALSRGVVNGVGAKVELPEGPLDFVLFAEGQPVFVLSFAKEHQQKIADIAKKQGVSYQLIGETGGDALVISGIGRVLGSFPCEQIKNRFENGFSNSLK